MPQQEKKLGTPSETTSQLDDIPALASCSCSLLCHPASGDAATSTCQLPLALPSSFSSQQSSSLLTSLQLDIIMRVHGLELHPSPWHDYQLGIFLARKFVSKSTISLHSLVIPPSVDMFSMIAKLGLHRDLLHESEMTIQIQSHFGYDSSIALPVLELLMVPIPGMALLLYPMHLDLIQMRKQNCQCLNTLEQDLRQILSKLHQMGVCHGALDDPSSVKRTLGQKMDKWLLGNLSQCQPFGTALKEQLHQSLAIASREYDLQCLEKLLKEQIS